MRSFFKVAAIAFGMAGALAASASAQPYDPNEDGYDQSNGQPYGQPYSQYGQPYSQPYGQPYSQDDAYGPYDGQYCDPNYDCPDDYYDLPLYYGDVYYDGGLYNGPFYYRDYGGRRQFWRNGGWHFGDFRGGRFGPALGRDFYRNHGFGGRSFTQGGNFGGQSWNRGGNGQDYARRAYQPQQSYQGRSFGGGQNWNRGGNFGGNAYQQQQGYQGRGGQNGNRGGQDYARQAYQPQQSAPVQPYNGARFGNRGGYAGQSNFQQQAPQPQTRSYEGHGHDGGGQRGNGGNQGGGWHHDH